MLVFGDVRVGSEVTMVMRARNIGSGTLHITNLFASGSTAFSLVSPPSLPISLPSGTEFMLTVRYRPTVESPTQETGTLTLATDDPATTNATVALIGRGVKPNLVVDPSPLSFGDVRVNTQQTRTVRVVNTGTGPITITSISNTGSPAFTLVNPPSGAFTLNEHQSLDLLVKFVPAIEAAEAGTLTLTTDNPDWLSVTINITGRGVRPNLVVEPNPLAFGDVRVGTELTEAGDGAQSGHWPHYHLQPLHRAGLPLHARQSEHGFHAGAWYNRRC